MTQSIRLLRTLDGYKLKYRQSTLVSAQEADKIKRTSCTFSIQTLELCPELSASRGTWSYGLDLHCIINRILNRPPKW